MAIIVKRYKTTATSPFFNRRFAVVIIVLIMFTVYVTNLWKMLSLDNEADMDITNEAKAKKFRFVEKL